MVCDIYLDLTCWDRMVAGILGLGLSKMGHGQGLPKQHRPEPEWQQKLSCWTFSKHFCSVDVFETFLLDWKAGLWINWRALQKAALLLYLEHGIWRILQVGSNFLDWSFQAKNKESATSTPVTLIPEFIFLQEAKESLALAKLLIWRVSVFRLTWQLVEFVRCSWPPEYFWCSGPMQSFH